MFDYMVLKPMIDDLERRVIAGAKEADRWSAEVGSVLKALLSRIEELEKKLAAAAFPITFLACPRCGHHMQHKPTGKVLTSMPPKTEIACVGCGLTRGVQ
jgi:hypothetical protein